MQIKVAMVSLGCAKNQVDGEMLMATLKDNGFETVLDPAQADIAIVNTCGFITSAKEESIGEILELVRLKAEGKIKKIVITGCLAQRYQKEIMRDIPEADAVIGIGANGEIATLLLEMMGGHSVESFPDMLSIPMSGKRELSTPSYFAYLKIAEGCDNCCTYCAIPLIRGKYRSREIEDVLSEAKELVKNGAKELVLVAQDTSRYGIDLYKKFSLASLVKELCKIENLKWIRLLYCYPDAITDELLDVIKNEEKVVKYIDMPLQHASGRILKLMNRTGSREELSKLILKIRKMIPDITLRTTFITGFPGETEEDFTELCEFIKEQKFEHMGCFAYSREEGTIAYDMDEQIDEDVKLRRAEIVTDTQLRILDEQNESQIGKVFEVLVEGFDRYAECYFGRSYKDAPDIDGKIFFAASKKPAYGEFVNVEITEVLDTDLVGVMIK